MSVLRVRDLDINTLLLTTVNPRISTQKYSKQVLDNARLVINIQDYIVSQVTMNIHKCLANPMSELVNYTKDSTTSAQFKSANSYLSSVCEKTYYRQDKHCYAEFVHAVKLCYVETLASLMVLSQTFDNVSFRITVPMTFAQNVPMQSTDGDIDEVLKYKGKFIFIDNLASVYGHLVAQNQLPRVIKWVIALGPHVENSIDISVILKKLKEEPSLGLKDSIALVYLVMQDIYAFMGPNEYDRNNNL